MFPICYTREMFKRLAYRMGRLPYEVRTEIEAVQPYHAADPLRDTLWGIEQVDAADKHRLLTPTAIIQDQIDWLFDPPLSADQYTGYAEIPPVIRFEHDAVAVVFRIVPPPPEVKVDARIRIRVAFGDETGLGSRILLMPSLAEFLRTTNYVIDRFSRFFPAGR
jgi:hypothetical protein